MQQHIYCGHNFSIASNLTNITLKLVSVYLYFGFDDFLYDSVQLDKHSEQNLALLNNTLFKTNKQTLYIINEPESSQGFAVRNKLPISIPIISNINTQLIHNINIIIYFLVFFFGIFVIFSHFLYLNFNGPVLNMNPI